MISLLVFFIILYTLYINLNLNKNKPRPPSPFNYPIVGNIIPILKNEGYLVLNEYYKKYGNIFQLKYGGVNTVVLSEYDVLKEAFIDNSDIFMHRLIRPSRKFKTGENIVNSNGIIWKKLQSIAIQELMTNHKIKKYESMMMDEANKLVEKFKEQADNGTEEDPSRYVKICFLNMMLSFLFDFRFEDYENEKVNQLVNHIHTIFRMGAKPIPYDFISILRLFKFETTSTTSKEHHSIFLDLFSFVNEIVDEKLKKMDNIDDFKPNCFVEILLLKYKSNEITMNQVIKTATDLMIAGSDTAGLFILHLIMALTNNQDIQEKVYDELSNLQNNGSNVNSIYSNKNNTHYLNAVLKETERRYTVSPLSLPHTTNKDTYLNGYFIPKDSQVIINVYSTHLNEKFWKEPLVFNPDRFIENQSLEKYLVGFGIGPRMCSGYQFAHQQVYLVAFSILKSIKFSSNKKILELTEPGTTLAPLPYFVKCTKR